MLKITSIRGKKFMYCISLKNNETIKDIYGKYTVKYKFLCSKSS